MEEPELDSTIKEEDTVEYTNLNEVNLVEVVEGISNMGVKLLPNRLEEELDFYFEQVIGPSQETDRLNDKKQIEIYKQNFLNEIQHAKILPEEIVASIVMAQAYVKTEITFLAPTIYNSKTFEIIFHGKRQIDYHLGEEKPEFEEENKKNLYATIGKIWKDEFEKVNSTEKSLLIKKITHDRSLPVEEGETVYDWKNGKIHVVKTKPEMADMTNTDVISFYDNFDYIELKSETKL